MGPATMITVHDLQCCDHAVQAVGAPPTLIGVFTRIHSPTFPVLRPQLCVAMLVQGAPDEVASIMVDLMPPTGPRLARAHRMVQLDAAGIAFLPCTLRDVPFPEPGSYVVTITADGEVLGWIALLLVRSTTDESVREVWGL